MHKALNPNIATDEHFFNGEYDFEETCPNCWKEIPIVIDQGEFIRYRLVCPACGKKLMLCNLCQYDGQCDCDWGEDSPCCRERFEDMIMALKKYK